MVTEFWLIFRSFIIYINFYVNRKQPRCLIEIIAILIPDYVLGLFILQQGRMSSKY